MNRWIVSCLTGTALAIFNLAGFAETIRLGASKDNTLYQSGAGSLSNGAGQHLFAGATASGAVRRGLLAFDIAGKVPAHAVIESAVLQLHLSRTQPGVQPVELHRVSADWGEGSSDAPANEGGGTAAADGDATWKHTFFPTQFWSKQGGDFSEIPSGSTSVGGAGNYTWGSTPGMVADVQSWLDRPLSNFGWLLLGNELGIGTAKRFDSRENPAEALRPVLTVEFTPPPPPSTEGDLDGDGDVDDDDLNLLLSDFASPASPQNHVDLNVLSSNFGRTDLGGAARGRPVPEPPASALAIAGLMGLLAYLLFTGRIRGVRPAAAAIPRGIGRQRPSFSGSKFRSRSRQDFGPCSAKTPNSGEFGYQSTAELGTTVIPYQDVGSKNMAIAKRFSKGMTALVLAMTAGTLAGADFPPIQLADDIVGQFATPVGLVNAGDGSSRLFVIDQRGRIQIIKDRQALATPFLDIESKLVPQRTNLAGQPTFDERGLLGLAFHPDFADPGPAGGRFYVYYSAPRPGGDPNDPVDPINHQSVIAEYRVAAHGANTADPASERILLTFDQPQFNHDAGQLAFGPDGFLYISTGDGGGGGDNEPGHTGGGPGNPSGGRGNAQDLSKLLGKVLRIDVDGDDGPGGQYGIPANNPFVGTGGGERKEIFAYGLRNPWRFSFDDGPGGTGRLFLADVGQGEVEEVDIITRGGNFGWRLREGSSVFDPAVPNPGVPLIDPIAEYSRSRNPPLNNALPKIGVAAVGGLVYRGSEFPELLGKYVFADWSTSFLSANGTLLGLEETSPSVFDLSALDIANSENPIGRYITALGEDEQGELYVVTNSFFAPSDDPTGRIFRITPVPVPEPATAVLVAAGGLVALLFRRRRPRARRSVP